MTMDQITLTLSKGSHKTPERGLCAMEAVAMFAGEAHSDAPGCACPIIASLVRYLNDHLPDEQRQLLTALIPRLAVSRASLSVMLRRAFIPSDVLIHESVPDAFDGLLGHAAVAAKLRGLDKIMDTKSALAARDALDDRAADAAFVALATHASHASRAARGAFDALDARTFDSLDAERTRAYRVRAINSLDTIDSLDACATLAALDAPQAYWTTYAVAGIRLIERMLDVTEVR